MAKNSWCIRQYNSVKDLVKSSNLSVLCARTSEPIGALIGLTKKAFLKEDQIYNIPLTHRRTFSVIVVRKITGNY